MKDKLNVSILGGNYVRQVVKPALENNENFEVVQMISPRKIISSKFDFSTFKFSDDIKNFFECEDIDFFILAIPPRLQYPFLDSLISAKKPFICEKPFTINLNQAESIHRKIVNSNLKCAVGYQFRFDPFISIIKSIHKELCFPIYDSIEVDWKTSGSLNKKKLFTWRDSKKESLGVISEWCSHVFDYVPYLTGSTFMEISCREEIHTKKRRNINGEYEEVKTPDEAYIKARLKSGTNCFINVNTAYSGNCRHSISLKKDGIYIKVSTFPPYSARDILIESNTNLNYKYIPKKDKDESRISSFRSLLLEYFDYFNNQNVGSRLATSKDALYSWKCMDACLKSIKNSSSSISIQ